MEFRTRIDIPKSSFHIDHSQQIVLFGSCFAENMGSLLLENNFNVNVNPFGILYNPFSISEVIKRIMLKNPFHEKDIVECNGLYVSCMHHGSFSSASKNEMLDNINSSLNKASDYLTKADLLLITFGTSYAYFLKENDKVVSNCHKFPASEFTRRRLSVDEIVEQWSGLIEDLIKTNERIKLLFTVSPIRHWKDGVHDNQLSKATLLLAVDALQQKYNNVFYFPSYEIVLDELRDYRFYAEDMIHPNEIAIKYIWEQFGNVFFNKETDIIIDEWSKISKLLSHRPFNVGTNEHKQFLRQTLLKLEAFQKKYPYLNCSKEITILKNQLA